MTDRNIDMVKLQLGCGVNVWPDYTNLDKNDYGQEIVRDVMRGLPFDDNKFDEVYSAHFMEHIPQGESLYFLMSEIWRVCNADAVITIIVPHSETPYAFYPDHLSYWNEVMVNALCGDPYQRSKILKYNFEVISHERKGLELISKLKVKK
jgi:predicted SAM-dependent methyltransferase